jgi:hypothetical protein
MSEKVKIEQQTSQYNQLINQTGNLLAPGGAQAAREVNTILVQTC